DPDFQAVAQPVAAPRPTADQGVRLRLQVIIVVAEAGDVNQTLDGEFHELAEEAEILDTDDDGVEGLPGPAFEMGQQLDLDQLALGGFGPALRPGTMFGQNDQLIRVGLWFLAVEDGGNLAVNL